MFFMKTLPVTNFPFKNGSDYETKQLSKEAVEFTKTFAIYFIFKSSSCKELSDLKEKKCTFQILFILCFSLPFPEFFMTLQQSLYEV